MGGSSEYLTSPPPGWAPCQEMQCRERFPYVFSLYDLQNKEIISGPTFLGPLCSFASRKEPVLSTLTVKTWRFPWVLPQELETFCNKVGKGDEQQSRRESSAYIPIFESLILFLFLDWPSLPLANHLYHVSAWFWCRFKLSIKWRKQSLWDLETYFPLGSCSFHEYSYYESN